MINKNLAQRVKQLRKNKGFSQEVLTENSGLSLRTIQRIENGETQPTGDTLKKIAQALAVTPNELIDWTVIEDKGYLKALNLAALSFLFFPLLGIIIPLIMWYSKKDKLKDINTIGKNVINFEITWNIILFAGIILNFISLIFVFESDGVVSTSAIISHHFRSFIFVLIMYILNTGYVIINTFRIEKNIETFYRPKLKFIRD